MPTAYAFGSRQCGESDFQRWKDQQGLMRNISRETAGLPSLAHVVWQFELL
jgi:hypothetical protein